MPTTVHQLIEGTEVTTGASPSVTLKYFVDGAASENAALDAVLSTCPSTYNGMPRQSRSAEPISDTKYLVTARYSPQASNDQGSSGGAPPESSYEFSTGGGSETMFVSLSTKQRVALPGGPQAPDFHSGVNVTNDGPQGVERTVPIFNFSETHYKTAAAVSNSYVATLFALTGTVNNSAFRGFSAGEVLFLGARGSKRGVNGDWEITYSFAASPNVTSGTIGGFTGINKDGWDYLWFLFEDKEDPNAEKVVRRPRAAYVEQIYKRGGFAGLGI
jgi:hypothetical protein